MQKSHSSFFSISWSSPLARILTIGFLALLLQIPVALIDDVTFERQANRNAATQDIAAKWGGRQSITGPYILLPIRHSWKNDKGKTQSNVYRQVILPETYQAHAKLGTEVRSRGIYSVPLYEARINLQGRFDLQKIRNRLDKPQHKQLWSQAKLVLGISDVRALRQEAVLQWNKQSLPLEPGTDSNLDSKGGFHSPIGRLLQDQEAMDFQVSLTLGGYDSLYFTPVGRFSDIRIESDWQDPSFQGNWLPAERQVGKQGFDARWQVPYLGRNFPQTWKLSQSRHKEAVQKAQVGVKLLYTLDTYGKTQRSSKYALMFIVLTFLCFWLFEVLSGVQIHPVQYLLVGSAISLFYLLLLSLAEHIGFLAAYSLASIAVALLIGIYSRTLLKQGRRALGIGAGLSILYGYLYMLLEEQDYALLTGSLGLFTILALVMFLTRKVNWYQTGKNLKEDDDQAQIPLNL